MKNKQPQTKDEGKVRCNLHATCTVPCDSRKAHAAASCQCNCHLNSHARCIEVMPKGPQDFIASEADGEKSMQVPGPAAARSHPLW